ncbi:MAG: twitching motility protein PilT [Anaerolineae bacterium]|nr:twitching motility protein PilT [Anaerolineae bacterium]
MKAILRFYANLNDFLPPDKRQQPLVMSLNEPVAVKHLIEAAGVPHPEVELIVQNGRSVEFASLVEDGDRVAVYPLFSLLDLDEMPRLRPRLPDPITFVLDGHLGQLAAYLRMLGFDCLYRNNYDDPELAQISHDENRVLLTRDRRLLMRKQVIHGYCLRDTDPRQQLLELLARFALRPHIRPWQRCIRCNGDLAAIAKEAIIDRLEPKTQLYYDEFQICQSCQQIYWQGSHFRRMQPFIEEIVNGH